MSLFSNVSSGPANNNNNSILPQPSIFGSTGSTGGGLLGNPQPSGGLFGNQIQQQQQPQGLFGNQAQQQPPTGGLFGNQVQQQSQGGSLFGGPQPSGGLFGGQAQHQAQSGSLFGGQVQQQSQGGSLFGGPQPSGGLFGGQAQHQAQSGSLFGGQVQQQSQGGSLFGGPSPSGGLFGGQIQQQAQSGSALRGQLARYVPPNGTVDEIGRNDLQYLKKNRENIYLRCITTRLRGPSLEELRMADYFNLKNDRLNPHQKNKIVHAIRNNPISIRIPDDQGSFPTGLPDSLKDMWAATRHVQLSPPLSGSQNLNQPASTSGSLFINPQPSSTLFGGNNNQPVSTSGSLFMNKPPSQMALSPMPTTNILPTQPSSTQSTSLPTQAPVVDQPKTKTSSTKTKKPKAATKSVNIISGSNPGSFNFEFNKMLFVSNLVQIMEKHNMTVPENLLNNTDFVPQLLEFLEQHEISLPTENVPQFQISSIAPVGTESENKDEEFDEY